MNKNQKNNNNGNGPNALKMHTEFKQSASESVREREIVCVCVCVGFVCLSRMHSYLHLWLWKHLWPLISVHRSPFCIGEQTRLTTASSLHPRAPTNTPQTCIALTYTHTHIVPLTVHTKHLTSEPTKTRQQGKIHDEIRARTPHTRVYIH